MRRDLVTVATFIDPVEAAMARNCLEASGIHSVLHDEQTIATDWGLGNAIGGIKLQVSAAQVERAEFLLSQRRTDDDSDELAQLPETAIATAETAEDLHYEQERRSPKNQTVERMFRSTVFGLFFWPLQFYALYLLLTLRSIEGTVSRSYRWKVWASVLLSLPLWSIIAIPLAFLGGLAPGYAWKLREFPQDGFVVRFPRKPEASSRVVDTPFGPATESDFFAHDHQSSFTVLVVTYHQKFAAEDTAAVLDREIDQTIALGNMVVQNRRNIKVNGMAAQQVEARRFQGAHVYRDRIRFYLSENRVFIQQAIWPEQLMREPSEVERFFDSFEIK
jgi:hypothetical protein